LCDLNHYISHQLLCNKPPQNLVAQNNNCLFLTVLKFGQGLAGQLTFSLHSVAGNCVCVCLCVCVCVLRHGLTLSHRLECSSVIITHGSLKLLGSRDPPASVCQVVRTMGTHNHAWLIFKFSVESGSCYAAQAGLELLGSNNPPSSASQSAGIPGTSHSALPMVLCFVS
uniref:Uncharacterized protein n=1 Tax=Macaca fascicularis TaxID=9541 RepID=A0A7N9CAK2_MACFA